MALCVTKCHFQCTPCWVCLLAGVFRRKKIEPRIRRRAVPGLSPRSKVRSAVRPEADIIFLKRETTRYCYYYEVLIMRFYKYSFVYHNVIHYCTTNAWIILYRKRVKFEIYRHYYYDTFISRWSSKLIIFVYYSENTIFFHPENNNQR